MRTKSFLLAATALSAAVAFAAIPARAGVVFVPEGGAGTVLQVDADSGETLARLPGLEAVHGLAGAPGARYLVAGSFMEISRDQAGAMKKPAGVGAADHAKHHGKKAAGAEMKAGDDAGVSILTVLDARTGEVVRRLEAPGAVHHTAVSPDGRRAVATLPGGDGVAVVDLEKLEMAGVIATGAMPSYAVFSADGGTLWVTNSGDGTIAEIDMAAGAVRRLFAAGESPEHFVRSPDGSALYVADADAGEVLEIATDTGETRRAFDIGGELHGIDVSQDGAVVFVSARERGRLAAIDVASGEMRESDIGPEPYHLTVIPGAGTLFVSSSAEQKVRIVDQANLAVTGEFAVTGVGHQMVALP